MGARRSCSNKLQPKKSPSHLFQAQSVEGLFLRCKWTVQWPALLTMLVANVPLLVAPTSQTDTFHLRFWSHQCANYTHHGVDGLTDTTLWQREPAKLPTAPSPCDTLKKVMDCQGSKSRISQLGRSTEWMKQLWTTTGEPRITFTNATRGEKDGACTCQIYGFSKHPKGRTDCK